MTAPIPIVPRTGDEPGAVVADNCLRCDRALMAHERTHGGRWREFCEPCREILRRQFIIERDEVLRS